MTKEEKIVSALDISVGIIDINRPMFQKIYPFTTENISGYIPKFKLKNQSLLTVGSSSDQVINASLSGCSDITVFDLCPYTKEYFYLKKAAILEMSLEEYENFLHYARDRYALFGNEDALNAKTFRKIAPLLEEMDQDSYDFWNEVITQRKNTRIRRNLFQPDEYPRKTVRRLNPYMKDEETFSKTRKKLEGIEPTFINGNLLTDEITGTYDNVFLSNVAAYNSLADVKKIVDKILPHLSDDGKLLLAYLYETVENEEYDSIWPEIYDVRRVFDELQIPLDISYFQGVNGIYEDAVITYQKKK